VLESGILPGMPLYDYRCVACGAVTEVRHGFGESHEGPCPSCGGALRRVFNPPPIHFKGSGFYVTDSRSGGNGSRSSSTTETSSDSAGGACANAESGAAA
jgi:putative FmdB family regulatory protein